MTRSTFQILPLVHALLISIEQGTDAETQKSVQDIVTRLNLCKARIAELPGNSDTASHQEQIFQQEKATFEKKKALLAQFGVNI